MGDGWDNVGLWLEQCWVVVGAMLAYGWRIWFMVGTLLGDGWHNVGLWLVIVGAMLGDSWHLVGFWLAVNVGPTSCIQQAK